MSLLGLDIGTTGCKCTMISIDGTIVDCLYKEYDIVTPGEGMFELDPREVWNAIKHVIFEVSNRNPLESPLALSISSLGEAVIPVDEKGRILGNAILCSDCRGIQQCKIIREKLGAETIMERTGIPVNPMFSINKILWLKQNHDELYKKTWKFMQFEDFVIFKLTGEPVTDYTLASRTMAFNCTTHEWDSEILTALDISPDLFPDALRSGTIVSKIKKSVAIELSLTVDLIIVTGGHDRTCEALGAGILDNSKAVDGIGTAECITMVYPHPVLNDKMIESNFCSTPYIVTGMYMTLAFALTSGAILKWYREIFAAMEKHKTQQQGKSVYQLLDSKVSDKPSRLLVLPHFAGSGTPYMDNSSKGCILGLSINTGKHEIYRAVMEGITYEILLNIERLKECGIKTASLRCVGGGSRSDVWLRVKADILGMPVEKLSISEGGTIGTAILAGTATGVYSSYRDAVNKIVKIQKRIEPDNQMHDIYMENYRKYKKIYSRIKEIFY